MNRKGLFTNLFIILFAIYTAWWIWLLIVFPEHDSSFNDYFADTYGILAGFGGLIGIYVSRKWGHLKSHVGRSLFFLSLGLTAQFLGQASYSAMFYLTGIENPYPAWGEIFFVSSIPLYIVGIWYMAKASGSSISLKSNKNIIWAVVFPLLMIGISYFFFLRDFSSEGFSFIETFLTYFYPIGQALFVSEAILAYVLTKKLLGGVMKNKVIFILFALVLQYAADSLFIFESNSGSWYPGGFSDFLFVVSYFLMALGFVRFMNVEKELPIMQEVPQYQEAN